MFKKFKENFFKKVKAAANQQPVMYNSISSFEQPPIAPVEIENRAMFNKGGSNAIKYNKGGYASIADMEKKCGSKTAKKVKR